MSHPHSAMVIMGAQRDGRDITLEYAAGGVLGIRDDNADACPQCNGALDANECEPCQLFQCACCLLWISWDDGGADDFPDDCSSCWCLMHWLLQPMDVRRSTPIYHEVK